MSRIRRILTRDEAIEIAREAAKNAPESYYQEPFQPHEWVIDAILEAWSQGFGDGCDYGRAY